MKNLVLVFFMLSTFLFSYAVIPKIKFKENVFFLNNIKYEELKKIELHSNRINTLVNCLYKSNNFEEEEDCLDFKIKEKFKKKGFSIYKKFAIESFEPIIDILNKLKKCIETSENLFNLEQCKRNVNLELQKIINEKK